MSEALVRAVGTIASGTGAVSPGAPAGRAVGDLEVMAIETAAQDASASGWTAVPGYTVQTTGNTRLTLLYRIITATGDATTTNDSGDHQIARILGIQAGTFDPDDIWNAVNGNVQSSTTTSVSISGLTTDADDCLVLSFCTGDTDPGANSTTEFSAWANSDLTSVTERMDDRRTSGDGGSLGCASGVKTTKGTVGATTATAANTGVRACAMLAINPRVTITDVETTEVLRDGQASVTLTGTNFDTAQGGGAIELSDNAVYASGTKVSQTVTSWGDTSADITISRGALSPGALWLWVTNDDGLRGSIPVTVLRPVAWTLSASSNITASGEATTAQLTAPSGKSTSDFDAGRISDDENPVDAVTVSEDDYTEIEWSIEATVDASGEYEFRVLVAGEPATATVTPEIEVASGSTGTVGGSSALSGAGASLFSASASASGAAALAATGASLASAAGAQSATSALSAVGSALVATAGQQTAASTISATGSALSAAAGAIAGTSSVASVGSALAASAGSIAATSSLAATVSSVAAVNGSAQASGAFTGDGASLASSAGETVATSAISGVGAALFRATGAIVATSSVEGVAQDDGSVGAVVATSALSGAGASRTAADGALSSSGALTAISAALTAGTGQIATASTLAAFGVAQAAADGALAVTSAVAGAAASLAAAVGAISTTSTIVGAGGAASEGAGTGDISAAGVLAATGASLVSATGSVAADATLQATGSGLAQAIGELVAASDLSGASHTAISAVGVASSISQIAGGGASLVAAVGQVEAVSSIAAVGVGASTAAGSLVATSTVQASSSSAFAGAGTLQVTVTAQAAGAALAATVGAITATATLSATVTAPRPPEPPRATVALSDDLAPRTTGTLDDLAPRATVIDSADLQLPVAA